MHHRFAPVQTLIGAAAVALACAGAARAAQPAAPSDADIAESLRARGIASRPVCYLSAVDFPYKPSGLGLLAPEAAVAEKLSKLGLLIMRQDPGGMSVRFDLAEAGRSAFNADAGSAERGFCAGHLVVSDIRRGAHGMDIGGRYAWPVTFTARMVPNPRAAWAKRPEADRLLPDIEALQAGQQRRMQVQVAQVRGAWSTVSDVQSLP